MSVLHFKPRQPRPEDAPDYRIGHGLDRAKLDRCEQSMIGYSRGRPDISTDDRYKRWRVQFRETNLTDLIDMFNNSTEKDWLIHAPKFAALHDTLREIDKKTYL